MPGLISRSTSPATRSVRLADLAQDRDLLVGLEHAGAEVEVPARHELRLRQPLAQPDVVLRRHVIELDGDAPGAHARLLQRVGEQVGRVLGELVVGADVGEARALAREVLLDVDDDLRREGARRARMVMVRRNRLLAWLGTRKPAV